MSSARAGAILWRAAAVVVLAQSGCGWQRRIVEDRKIENEVDAVAVAREVTGFAPSPGMLPLARRFTVERDDTPFVWRELVGAAAWRVEFANVSLDIKAAAAGAKDPFQRTFVVLMLEETGRVWSVRSIWPEPVADLKPEPPPDVAEAQMRPEKDVYVGLATENPRINFQDALGIVLNNGVGSPFQAKEIDAVYVMESERNSVPRPVWAITLRGIPPLPVSDPSIPVWQRNRMRNVVNANTGKLLFATNSPQPN